MGYVSLFCHFFSFVQLPQKEKGKLSIPGWCHFFFFSFSLITHTRTHPFSSLSLLLTAEGRENFPWEEHLDANLHSRVKTSCKMTANGRLTTRLLLAVCWCAIFFIGITFGFTPKIPFGGCPDGHIAIKAPAPFVGTAKGVLLKPAVYLDPDSKKPTKSVRAFVDCFAGFAVIFLFVLFVPRENWTRTGRLKGMLFLCWCCS